MNWSGIEALDGMAIPPFMMPLLVLAMLCLAVTAWFSLRAWSRRRRGIVRNGNGSRNAPLN